MVMPDRRKVPGHIVSKSRCTVIWSEAGGVSNNQPVVTRTIHGVVVGGRRLQPKAQSPPTRPALCQSTATAMNR